MGVASEVGGARAEAAIGRAGLTLGLCFCAALAEGFDITSMGVAAPHLGPALGISKALLGPVFSASTLGLFVGALLVGRLADRVGRKWTLVGSLAAFAVFSFATAFAHGYRDLFVIRVAAGLGLGGAFPNLIAMAAEVTAERRRALMTTIVAAGMPFGGALSSVVAAGADWRWIFYIGGAAPAVLAAVMAAALRESPDFLQSRQAPARATGFYWALAGQRRMLATLFLWVATFCGLMALYQLLNWLPILLGEKGLSKHDASIVAALFNLGGGLGVMALAVLMERGARTLVVGVWCASLVGSLILLAWVGPQIWLAGAVAFLAGAFSSSMAILLYGLAPGYYPTEVRATGVGATVAVGRLGAIVGPLVAADLLTAGFGQAGVLLALVPLALIAGVACMALLTRPTVVE